MDSLLHNLKRQENVFEVYTCVYNEKWFLTYRVSTIKRPDFYRTGYLQLNVLILIVQVIYN
jgi:hypothetical protein